MPSSRTLLVWCAAAVFCVGGASRGYAQFVWQGDTGNDNWNTNGNWAGNADPTSSATDDAVFNADTATTYNIDLNGSNRNVRTVTFDAATLAQGFDFTSKQVRIGSGGLINNDDQQQRFQNIRLEANQTWMLNGGLLFDNNLIIRRNLTINNTGGGTGGININNRLQLAGNRTLTYNAATEAQIDIVRLNGAQLTLAGSGDIDIQETLENHAGNRALINNSTGTVTINDVTLSNDATNRTLTLGGTADTSITGVISNGSTSTAGNLTKTGTGTLILSGANTYGGTTVVNEGTLAIANAASLGTTAAGTSVSSGATLELENNITVGAEALTVTDTGRLLNNSGANTFNGIISGTGKVEVTGGTLTLSGANTYSGATTITGGTLSTAASEVIGDSSNVVIGGSGTLSLNGAYTETVGSLSGSGSLFLNSGSFTTDTADNTTFSGMISDYYASFTKAGTGDLTLSGDNSFGNITTISGGTLIAAHDNALGGSTFGNIVTSGATLGLQGGITVDEGSFSVTGTGDGGTGAIRNLSGNNELTAQINLGGAATFTSEGDTLTLSNQINLNSGNLTISGSGNLVASNQIFGSNGVTKTGTGTLTFSGSVANSHSGSTDVNEGTLLLAKTAGTLATGGGALNIGDGVGSADSAIVQLGADNQIADYASSITVASDGQLDINGFTESINTVSGTGNITLGSGSLDVGINSGNSTFGGVVSGTGDLSKSGSGTFTLSGANTFTGTTTVDGGTLIAAHSASLGTGAAGTTVETGAKLSLTNGINLASEDLVLNGTGQLENTSGTNTFGGVISGAGVVNVATGNLTFSGDNTYTGDTTLSGGTLQIGAGGSTGSVTSDIINNSALIFNHSDGSTYANVLSGSGTVEQAGTGNLTFSGNNTYTGATTVSAGTLTLASDTALGTAAAGTTVDSGAILSLTNNITVASEAVTNNGTVTNTSGTNTFNGVISGTGALTTTGGNLTLGAINTYTGNTTVGSGTTLTLSADDALGTGSTTVNSGGTLALTGGITVDQTSYSVTGTGNASAGAVQNLAGSNRLTGDFTLADDTTFQSDAGTLNIGTDVDGSVYEPTGDQIALGTNDLTFDGDGTSVLKADLTGTGNLIKNGNGQFIMANGTSSWTGTTQINDGEMVLATYFNDAPGVGPLADFGIRGPIVVGDGTEGAGTATLTLGTADSGSGNFDNMFAADIDVTINSDGRLDTRGHTAYVRDIDLDGGSINAQTGASGGNDLFVTGDITSTSTTQVATIDGFVDFNGDSDQSIEVVTNSTLDINARIQNGGIDKTGDGTLILSGGNTFTDDVDVLDGIVRIDNNLGLGSVTGGTNVSDGAQLQLDGVTVGVEALTLNGAGISSDGALRTVTNTANSWAGTVAVATNSEIEVTADATLAISGNITGANTLTVESIGDTTFTGTNSLNTLTKTGAGNLTVSTNNNTYVTANINAGDFTLGTSNILADTMDVNLGGSGTFNVGTYTDTIDDLVGSGTLEIASGGNLTIDELGGSLSGGNPTGGFTGTLDVDGIMTLNGGLISGGTGAGSTGELILTANNTLEIASNFTFGTVGTMGGGDQLGTLTLQDSTRLVISGGHTVNLGTLNIDGDSVIDFTAADANTLNLGSLTFTAGSSLVIDGWNSWNDLWTTQNFPGANLDIRDDDTAKITFSGFSDTDTIWLTSDFGSNEITVPEPSSYGALLIAFALAVWTTRRPRRQANV